MNLSELRKKVKSLRQEKPKRMCINAESHLFGSCFECKKIDGYNIALDDIELLLTEIEMENVIMPTKLYKGHRYMSIGGQVYRLDEQTSGWVPIEHTPEWEQNEIEREEKAATEQKCCEKCFGPTTRRCMMQTICPCHSTTTQSKKQSTLPTSSNIHITYSNAQEWACEKQNNTIKEWNEEYKTIKTKQNKQKAYEIVLRDLKSQTTCKDKDYTIGCYDCGLRLVIKTLQSHLSFESSSPTKGNGER